MASPNPLPFCRTSLERKRRNSVSLSSGLPSADALQTVRLPSSTMIHTSLPVGKSPKRRAAGRHRDPVQVQARTTHCPCHTDRRGCHQAGKRLAEIREELQENIDHKLIIDDFSQYAPIAAVYGLDLFGVKGRHDAIDQTVILATAYTLIGASVNSLKTITKVERLDESSRNSFPSGHTATAFMGAELLRREYWDVSPWIGVAGYVVAAGTGFFRMYNTPSIG